MINAVLNGYGLSAANYRVKPFGPGLISCQKHKLG
jgi:hypothetical protein